MKLDLPNLRRFFFIGYNIPAQAQHILDVGCAEGDLHQWLKEKFPHKVKGIDFEGYDFGFQVNKPDITHDLNTYPWPLKKESMDVIVAGEIIEHVHNPSAFLKECYRILTKGGIIIITTPNACGIHHILENPKHSEYERPYGHIHFFTESALRRILGYCKFTFLKVDYITYRKFLPLFYLHKRLAGTNLMVVAKKPAN